MSKIGKKPVAIPQGVEAKIDGRTLLVKGPKGSLDLSIHHEVAVAVKDQSIVVAKAKRSGNSKLASAIWGLTRSLIENMVTGVSQGYEKKLELQGVGYRINMSGKKIVLALGFSHPVEVAIPEDVTVKLEENNIISIGGINKQRVGQFAADIRSLKKAEPYKGKGFRYVGEKVRRKAGKKAGTVK